MNETKKKLKYKIIKQFILFSIISLLVLFTFLWTNFLTIIPFAIIWTFWLFNIFEYHFSINIESKYRKIWAYINGIFVLLFIIGAITFHIAFDTEDGNMNIIALIISIIVVILFIISSIIFISNIVNIIKKYYWILKMIKNERENIL